MNRKKGAYPTKRTMNLFYKPDRTTKPATVALYVLFALTCVLGLGKVTVYDLWAETRGAEQTAAGEQTRLEGIMAELADYSEVQERYSLYSATEEERAAIDRMEVLELLDGIPAFPKGVVNAISGRGSVTGAVLADHPDVDMISLTGGLETGQAIMKTAARTMKKASLELGGKSPNVIFADADLDKALPFAVKAIFMNAGQLCTVGSRLVLEESLVDSFLPRLKAEAEKLRPGYCMDEQTNLGPVISQEQMDKILGYIDSGKACSTLITGGYRLTENGLDKGFYIAPTIFLNPPMDAAIVQEEIFGPVLTVQTFKTKEEALAIANGTSYGLASAVWSRDIDKAMWVARRLRAGSAWVNCYNKLLPECETGGYKQSGMDRAGGTEGMLKYTEVKHLCIDFMR